jgi:hypothetical protein
MIREESREFGIAMLAGLCSGLVWENAPGRKRGTPSTLLSIAFPFGVLLDYISPEKRRHVQSLYSDY